MMHTAMAARLTLFVTMIMAMRSTVAVRVPVFTVMLMGMIVAIAACMRFRRLRGGFPAACSPAGIRHRGGDTHRERIVRVGAARAGCAVSFVVGTLGVGHHNLLNSLTV
ncbi:hypothetical protein [Burkholderia sp. Bp8963]|uniref:hypothetical protein n=1 Tax=Burkholderia sp. Bp8963 TaxID=2184547 RepID=UPI0021AB828C|nr:hypothetical protein [Burkholderia sp. Bp8963]